MDHHEGHAHQNTGLLYVYIPITWEGLTNKVLMPVYTSSVSNNKIKELNKEKVCHTFPPNSRVFFCCLAVTVAHLAMCDSPEIENSGKRGDTFVQVHLNPCVFPFIFGTRLSDLDI